MNRQPDPASRMAHPGGILAAAGILLSLGGAPAAPSVRPACATATTACTEWVTLRGGPARSAIYRSHSLHARNDSVRRALIMVHGTNRNADHYFETAMAAAFLSPAPSTTP